MRRIIKPDNDSVKVIAKKSSKGSRVIKIKKSTKSKKSIIIPIDNPNPKRIKHTKIKINIDDFNENGEFRLDDLSEIKYYQDFIPNKLHDDLFNELSNDVPWTHGVYNMFGKPVKTPRLLYAMRDSEYDIKKVYKVTESMTWTTNMLKLKKLIEKKTGVNYSYAQLNFYRNGDDYIGYHTDSEVQKGDVISSVSLGVDRNFTFRSTNYKTDDSNIYELMLEKRSLIIMDENSAKNRWKHTLPKMKKLKDIRINITFRPN